MFVTGGSRGIGLEVSRELARRGARVIVAARGTEAVTEAVDGLDGAGHEGIVLDVSDEGSWVQAIESIDDREPLHGLVTAAGVLGPIGRLEDIAPSEFGRTIAVNLIGTMLALHHLLPLLRCHQGRAVTFSGGGATSPLPRYDAYAASKAAVVRLTENLADRDDVEINCVAPGFVATRMHEATLQAGPEAAGVAYHERTVAELAQGGVPATEAAELVCFLLSADAMGITGRLVSAQWDPWRDLAYQARLRTTSALGKLRRIDDQFFAQVADT